MKLQLPSNYIKKLYRNNFLRIKITLFVVMVILLVSTPVFLYFSALDILDRGNAEYDKLIYRSLEVENEVRRVGTLREISTETITNRLSPDERVFVENKDTQRRRLFKNNESPEGVGKVERHFTSIVINWLQNHYAQRVKDYGLSLTAYIDPKTDYAYGIYTRSFINNTNNDQITVKVTRNVTAMVVKPLEHLLSTMKVILPWYLLTISILTFWAVTWVFRMLGKGIDSGLANIEENNYKGRLEVSNRYGKEIAGIKVKINHVLERMDEIVSSNIESLQDVSHEVNTHLTAMKQSVDVIKMYGHHKPEFALAKLETIDQSIQRTTAIMTTILELAKLEQETSCTSYELQNVKDLTESFVNHYRKVFPDFKFFTEYECDKPKMLIDPEHFFMAIKPIIENAARYSANSKYIALEIKGGCGQNKPVSISIKNRGIGINKEDIPYIFERKFRGDTGSIKGTGLGLSITKKVVDLYGAQTEVTSEPGKETIFTLIFPNREQESEDLREI